MKEIVIIDGHVANPGDLHWNSIAVLGNLKVYERTSESEFFERAASAEILIVNKFKIDRSKLSQLKNLKCICLLATGYDNIDIEAASDLGVTVCNAVGYSSQSVAQHVFALLLALINQVEKTAAGVKKGVWTSSKDWCYYPPSLIELSDKVLGIYGLGKIGMAVAEIGQAFGMTVIGTKRSKKSGSIGHIRIVDETELVKESDIISLHAPLTDLTSGFFNADQYKLMKKTAYLINTGRGGLIHENDLFDALESGEIAGAGLDVLSEEPPPQDHILLNAKNCIITPHQAWATLESRARLIDITAANIQSYINGEAINVVNPVNL